VQVRLVLQPFEEDLSLYEALDAALADERLTDFVVVVAWAKESGLRRLRPLLGAFRARGGTASVVLGIDEGGATLEGLRAAITDFDEAMVLFDSTSGTFHPKMYIVSGNTSSVVIIASNNMTAGGLFANYEAGTCLDLDLTQLSDRQVHEAATQYVKRLREDETSRILTEDLIEQLLANPGIDIRSESDRRRDSEGNDDSLGLAGRPEPLSRLFGSSQHRKKRDPGHSRQARAAAAAQPERPVSAGTPLEGGSTAEVVARWRKQLTRSDSAQPRQGSQTTGALRFTKAGQPINQATWFREWLFANEVWQPDPSHVGRELASARFEVSINGVPMGTHELQVKYDAERESGQHNFTTDLKWGPLSPILRSDDFTGQWVTVEKLSDDALRLTIAELPLGDFLGPAS
jgi:HKD family nuclease